MNARADPSGAHSKALLNPNSSSYTQSGAPLMISLNFPSKVIWISEPKRKSAIKILLFLTNATFVPVGEKVAKR